MSTFHGLYEQITKMQKHNWKRGKVMIPIFGYAAIVVAVERAGWKFVGIDIWGNAKAVLFHIEYEEFLISDIKEPDIFNQENIIPGKIQKRRDDGDEAAVATGDSHLNWSRAKSANTC